MEGQPVLQIAGTGANDSPTRPPQSLRSGPNEFVLILGGMGPKGAHAKAEEALGMALAQAGSNIKANPKPDAILVIGLCGGLKSSLTQNRIVAYSDCLSTDPHQPPLQCSPAITNAIADLLLLRNVACERVIGITSPRIAVTKDDRLALAKVGGDVVDMESYPILSAAARAGIPPAVLRVVSDTPETQMPDFNRALNREGALDRRKALWVAVGSPFQTVRLRRGNKRAMAHLTKALEITLPSNCFSATRT